MADRPAGCLPFLAAAIAAALAAPFWFGGLDLAPLVFFVAFIVAAVHVALIAGPVYFWLDGRLQPRLLVVLAAAILIGALPTAIVATLLADDGAQAAEAALACGSCGLAGGVAFWLVLAAR